MLYAILKIITNVFYRVHYQLELKGLKKIYRGKPMILAPNHSNGFVDPIIMGMSVPQKVRFFARGDVFKKKIARWILNQMNISPMYRLQEGYSELKKNDKTFEECRKLLSENKTILLFPEAICIPEKRLQPLKKGLSRIIFQTEEAFDFKKNVWVVPIGLNYSDAKKFRSRLFVNVGEPISLKKYEEAYQLDKVRTINDFTKMLEQEMTKLIIVIKNKENDKLVENINEIYLYQWMKDKHYGLKNIEKQFHVSKEIAEMVNYHDTMDPVMIDSLRKKIIPFHKQLLKLGLRDHLLRTEHINKMNLRNFIADFIIAWFGTPVYVIALALNYPPYYIAKNYSDKKIKKEEFYASVFINMSMLLWLFYFAIQLVTVALAFHNWPLLLIYALTVPVTGLYAVNFYPVKKKISGRWRLLRLVRKDRESVERLMKERVAIMDQLDFLKKEYLKFVGIKS